MEAMGFVLDQSTEDTGSGVGSMGDAEVQQSIVEMLVGRHTGPVSGLVRMSLCRTQPSIFLSLQAEKYPPLSLLSLLNLIKPWAFDLTDQLPNTVRSQTCILGAPCRLLPSST